MGPQAKPRKGDPFEGHGPGLMGDTDERIARRISFRTIMGQRRGRSGTVLAGDHVRAGLRGCPSRGALVDPVQRKELRQDSGFCSGLEGSSRNRPGSRSSRVRCKGVRRIRFRLSVPRLVLSRISMSLGCAGTNSADTILVTPAEVECWVRPLSTLPGGSACACHPASPHGPAIQKANGLCRSIPGGIWATRERTDHPP